MNFSTAAQVHAYINTMPMFASSGRQAARFGLEGITALCEAIGNPQRDLRCIHIAGTNGKGSVCQLLHGVLSHAGYRTGLYTSPHLERVTQRFVVNGTEMSDTELLEFFREHGQAVLECAPTFFELTTAIAFWHFSRQRTDICVIETGLGGRLDATNVITPLVSVITSIGLDHTEILGETLAKIAAEKAGIIKEGVPVVTGKLPPEAFGVIRATARSKGVALHNAADPEPEWENGNVTLRSGIENHNGMLTLHTGFRQPVQRYNIATAVQVLSLLHAAYPVRPELLTKAMAQISASGAFAGRFEQMLPGADVYYDGAHNTEAFSQALQLSRKIAGERKMVLVFSLMRDKLTPELCRLISEFDELFYFEGNYGRTASLSEIQQYLPDTKSFQSVVWSDLKDEALAGNIMLLFSGSLYFYGLAKKMVDSGERAQDV